MTRPSVGPPHRWEEVKAHAPVGYAVIDQKGRVVEANPMLSRWVGADRDDLVGRRFADLWDAGSRVLWLTHQMPQLARRSEVHGVRLALLSPAGRRTQVSVSATLVSGVGGTEIHVALLDAAEQSRFESALVASRRSAEIAQGRAMLLQEVAVACAVAHTPGELARAVVDAAVATGATTSAGLWLHPLDEHPLGRTAPEPAAWASATLPSGQRPVLGPDLLDHAVRSDGPLRVDDLVPGDPGREALRRLGATALAVADLEYDGAPLGALGLFLIGHDEPTVDAGTVRALGALVSQALVRTRMHEELAWLAGHDVLTRLPNRGALTRHFANLRERPEPRPVAVFIVDLDGFKAVNDGFGHAAGDRVLEECGTRLRSTVRSSDLVARLGGDEFVVVCEGMDLAEARTLGDRLVAVMENEIAVGDGSPIPVRASVGGVVTLAAPDIDEDQVLGASDREMYTAKRLGGGRAQVEPLPPVTLSPRPSSSVDRAAAS